MFKVASGFWRSKTTWTVVSAIVTAAAGAATGQVSWQMAVGGIFASLFALFHNDTHRKIGEQEADDRSVLIGMAMGRAEPVEVPKFDLETVLHAHGSTLKDAVAKAVTAALMAALSPEAKSLEPRKPVQLLGSGVDARSAIANEVEGATGVAEEDGEADLG